MARWIFIAIVICSICCQSALAKSDWPEKSGLFAPDDLDYCFQRISDTLSNLWLCHSNRMAIGKPFRFSGTTADDQEQTENLPFPFNARFPARSQSEYLYGAGLWVGGIKGNDTLVTHSFDFVAPTPELIPIPCPDGAFHSGPGLADMEHDASATDTIIYGDTLYRCQVGDCNDWYPLGIEVTSHSHAWVSPPYDHSVIVDYVIKNVSATPIEKGWAGIYTDCDIGTGGGGYTGDVSGFIDGIIDGSGNWNDLNLAYSNDMDGDPGGSGFERYSTTGAFGVQLLGLSQPGYRVNFNWWVPGVMGQDWGPRQDETPFRDLGGSFAAPHGDSNQYYLMSHPEVDYNQVEAGLTHPGWLPPGEVGRAVAGGGDTRFLISAGPFDLSPGDSVIFTVAYVGGDNVITNPFIGSWFDSSDPLSVSDYYDLMHPDSLVRSALAAKAAYESHYRLPPPGPPGRFTLVDYDDTVASFVWNRRYVADMAGYHFLEKIGSGNWQTIWDKNADDTTLELTALDSQTDYHFAVAAVDSDGNVGATAPVIDLRPGRPHPPAHLSGICHNVYPVLTWTRSRDSDVTVYHLYRIDNAAGDTLLLGETADTTWTDLSAGAAISYAYYVTALAAGLESHPSPTVNLVPLPLSSGILVYNANFGVPSSNLIFRLPFFDSLAAQALDGIHYDYRQIDQNGMLGLAELSKYSLMIVSCENRSGSLTADLESILPTYLANGGKVILILRLAAVSQSPTANPRTIVFSPVSVLNQYLFLDSSYVGPLIIQPGSKLIGDLVGARPISVLMPGVAWDSSRVNQYSYQVPNGLPFAGYLFPHAPAEPLFAYQSSRPDSSTQGHVDAIRYKGSDYQFYLFNMPLSEMKRDSAAALLRQAVFDLKEDFLCGDITGDFHFNIGDMVAYVNYLYKHQTPPALYAAGDANCDSHFNLADLIIMINFFLRQGVAPGCCR
jgi:hypothetical protein